MDESSQDNSYNQNVPDTIPEEQKELETEMTQDKIIDQSQDGQYDFQSDILQQGQDVEINKTLVQQQQQLKNDPPKAKNNIQMPMIVEHITQDYKFHRIESLNNSSRGSSPKNQYLDSPIIQMQDQIQQNPDSIDSKIEQRESQIDNSNINNEMQNSSMKPIVQPLQVLKPQNQSEQQKEYKRQLDLKKPKLINGQIQSSVPILSYKAEIIWDPQPTIPDFYINPLKNIQNLSKSYSQKSMPKMKQNMVMTQEQLQKNIQIPFVNLEKNNYVQDIQNRKQYYGTLKSESNSLPLCQQLQQISKPPLKRTRMHKTKFKIAKSSKNIKQIQQVCIQYINENKKFINTEIVKLPEYERSAPFLPSTLEFADQLLEDKQHFKEKYGFEEKNLRKNKCILESVVLTRLDKRETQRQKARDMKKPFQIGEISNAEEIIKIQQNQLNEELQNFQNAQKQFQSFSNAEGTKLSQQNFSTFNNYRDLKALEKQQTEKKNMVMGTNSKKRPSTHGSRKSSARSQPNLPKIIQTGIN